MEIGKEIDNHKFENNHQKSIVNLIYTYGWITNLLGEKLNKYDITLQQYNVMRILRGQHPNPATINLIKVRMLDKMSDASRIVERLVHKELVGRTINTNDRRSVDILITKKGLDILVKLDTELLFDKILGKDFNNLDAGMMSDLLDKMRA
ncbi:MarR family winged helix-turn-helix transcriptional regulator [Daejeonella sp.]|jgi:DNA-binding MarR family transcriptional regulator|uniref:MarR family winged helix-turn-helix transcriptional regulator n=1 Tax=Daejeonella sp. TaxID=2805397 RepID=UPI003784FEDD